MVVAVSKFMIPVGLQVGEKLKIAAIAIAAAKSEATNMRCDVYVNKKHVN